MRGPWRACLPAAAASAAPCSRWAGPRCATPAWRRGWIPGTTRTTATRRTRGSGSAGHALPALEETLGPGIAEALARSAAQLSADCDALDAIARTEEWRIQPAVPPERVPPEPVQPAGPPEPGPAARAGDAAGNGDGDAATILSVADIEGLGALAPAIRTRVLRRAALLAGCPGGSLTAAHVAALDALVTGWHGQRGADLPGAVRVQRRYGRLLFGEGRPVSGRPARAGSPEWTEAEATGGRE